MRGILVRVLPWMGWYAYPWLGSTLVYILSTPYWNQGIVPSLILKILLLKGTLLLGPPIALGALVVGQGTGLILGKLVGMKLVRKASRARKLFRRIKSLKSLYLGTGWKPWRIRLRIPGVQKFRFHRSYPPPPHFQFHKFPAMSPIKYLDRTYGTYKYEPEPEWQSSHSGWLPSSDHYKASYSHSHENVFGFNKAAQESRDPIISTTIQDYVRHLRSPRMPANLWNRAPLRTHFGKHVILIFIVFAGWSKFYVANFILIFIVAPRKLSFVQDTYDRTKRFDDSPSEINPTSDEAVSVGVEEFVRAEIMKLSSGNYSLTESPEEIEKIKELIRVQFAKDLMESMGLKTIPEFIPFPNQENTTILENVNKTVAEVSKDDDQSDNSDSKAVADVLSTVMSSIQNLNPINFIPEGIMSWFKPENDELTPDKEKTATTFEKTEKEEENGILDSVVRDIRNLFTIVSFLDIDGCLEKLICEIHSRGQTLSTKDTYGYEEEVITAFR